MGQPVVHFEVIGKDGAALQSFYSDLFGWKIDTDNPMNYGVVQHGGGEGTGIGGGIGTGPEGYPGHVTFYIGVPDVEAALTKAESLGGSRVMGHGSREGHGRGRDRPFQRPGGAPDRRRQGPVAQSSY